MGYAYIPTEMGLATFFHHDDADLDPDDLLRPEEQFSTPWGDSDPGACDKCSGSGRCHYRCLSCIEEGPREGCPSCGGRAEFEGVCPACEGDGEITRTRREGVSVFPTEGGLYRYLVEQGAELDGTVVVEVAGDLSPDRDLDADSGALLAHPQEIVSVREIDEERVAELRSRL
jgi:hypothetical protein